MSLLRPHATYRVHESANGIVVDLPSPRRPLAVALLLVWLAAWTVGLGFVGQQFVHGDGYAGDRLFLVAWTVLWFAAGIVALLHLAWQAAGAERITLAPGVLEVRRGVGGLAIRHRYALADVSELRTFGREVPPVLALGLELAGRGASGVRFRHAGHVVRCARALDERAAHALVEVLRERSTLAEPAAGSHQGAA
jgi:hypothetical protein